MAAVVGLDYDESVNGDGVREAVGQVVFARSTSSFYPMLHAGICWYVSVGSSAKTAVG